MFPIKRWLRFNNLPPFLDKTIWKTNRIHHRLGSKVILSVICRQFPPPRSILETQPYRHLFFGCWYTSDWIFHPTTGRWFGTFFIFHFIYGLSSFPLTFIFFKMVIAPPTRFCWAFACFLGGMSCNM